MILVLDANELAMLRRMQTTADRIQRMIYARACEEYALAFGSPDRPNELNACIVHNSLISFEEGKPWCEVDYRHMRRVRWLLEKQHEPSRLVHKWYRRKTGLLAD